MMRKQAMRRMNVSLPCLFLLAACGGEDERPRPPTFDDAAASGGANTGGRNGASGAGRGGEESDAGGGSHAGNGGVPEGGHVDGGATDAAIVDMDGATDAGGRDSNDGGAVDAATEDGAPPFEPCASDSIEDPSFDAASLCDPSASWTEESALTLPGEGNEVLVGITPDERTVVWSAALGPALSFFVADRPSSDDSFTTAEQILDSEVLALGADGLSLVVTSDSRAQLYERRRDNRSEPFGEPVEGVFSQLNLEAANELWIFSSVAIAPDARTLFYATLGDVPSEHPLRVSTRTDTNSVWPVGRALTSCEFEMQGEGLPHPSGISADGLTLFYDDGVRQRARAAFRTSVEAPFSVFVDLDDRRRAQPNLACDRIYYSKASPPGILSAQQAP